MRRTGLGGSRKIVLRTQREAVRNAMLEAAKLHAWLTLSELARRTRYGEASISAQLRHLRKPQYGGFVLQKRCREQGTIDIGYGRGPVWEYKLSRKPRISFGVRKLASALTAAITPADQPLVTARPETRRPFEAQDKRDRRTPHVSRVRRGAR